MFRRPIVWITVAVLACAVGAWWLLGRRNQTPEFVRPAAIAQALAASVSSAPAASAAVTSNAPAAAAATSRDPYAKYRLSNTTESKGSLLRRDAALDLENAHFDITKPLDLNIPAHLRAKDEPGTYLVKSAGHIDNAFRARLQAAGLTLVEGGYFPHDAWLVRGTKAQVDALGRSGLAAVVPWEPYFKVKSALLPLAVEQQPMPAGTYLNVLLFADAKEATSQSLKQMGVSIYKQASSPFGPVLTVHAPADGLVAMAQLSGVQLIERAGVRAPVNDLSRVKLGVSTNSVLAGNYLGLTGSNVVVAVADSGVDMTHPDLTGRVSTNTFLAGTDTSGHGTHVAGIIGGSGASSGTVLNVPQGSVAGASYRGKAPGSLLYAIKLDETPVAGLDFDSYQQQQIAATNALVANESWGKPGIFDYDLTAASYDWAVRDSAPDTEGSQSASYVFAAGNNGGGSDEGSSGAAGSIQSPSTGKNVITVGGLEQLRNITNQYELDGATNSYWQAKTDTDSEVGAYSGRGNTGIGVEGDFGRVKPDLVAPGTFVMSLRSQQWDEGAYYSITNIHRQVVANQVVAPGELNQYSLSLPFEALGARILVTPFIVSSNSVTNLPIYVNTTGSPTTADTSRTNVFDIPTDLPLTPGGSYFYAVGNDSSVPVTFTLTTEITVTNKLKDHNRALKELNDLLGPYYRYETGTSMSAPAVSGILALMHEYYATRMGRTNSPALMKALLINGARSASSLYDLQVQNSIDYQGWGLPNLRNSLAPAATNAAAGPMFFYDQSPTNALATGDSQTRTLLLSNNAQGRELRVTLVWTDPPGNPAAGVKLVNDLDLIVTNLDSGAVYYGNDFPSGDFTAQWETNNSPLVDVINNVENVYLRRPLGTNFAVVVKARRVNVNAVATHTNACVQDYALVISSGNGEVTDAITVTESPVTNSVLANVHYVTNTTPAPLLNQTVGANAPLIAGINGVTNQWQFYVVTNYGTNANFTNAAFLTFSPSTLSVPRMGVRTPASDEFTRAEADIDLYVSTNPALTNLDAAAVGGALRSVGRGGTETIVISNSAPGVVYYVGVKSEDQMGAQYGFLAVFSDQPFSNDDDGNIHAVGIPAPVVIPDGTPARPGSAFMYGIVVQAAKVRRVVVTNTLTHENFGDLLGNLSHNTSFAVLNNHSPGNGLPTQMRVYEDNEQNDIPGSQKSDGPGNLKNFVGLEAIGQWMLTELDNGPTSTGRVENLLLTIEKQDILNGDNLTIQPQSWTFDWVEVPAGATNLTLTVVNNSATPLPLDMYVRRGDFPDFTDYDKKATMDPVVDSMSISVYDTPPLRPGIYYIGIYNPNLVVQKVNLRATIELDLAGLQPVIFPFAGSVPIKDDAVTTVTKFVARDDTIVSTEVGLSIGHARISDLAIQLQSPSGKRVLLFENRGGADTNGMGQLVTGLTSNVWQNSFEESQPGTAPVAGDYFSGGWQVLSGSVDLLSNYIFASLGGPVAYQGNWCIDLDGSSAGTIRTNIATVPGVAYSLTLAYTCNPDRGTSVPSAAILVDGTNILTVSPNLANAWSNLNWQTTSVPFVASSSNTSLTFQSLDPANSPYGVLLDAITVSVSQDQHHNVIFTENTNKVSEPGSLLKFKLPPFVPIPVTNFIAPPGWTNWSAAVGGNGHWYKAVANTNNNITWAAADAIAVSEGGYLATITSAAENTFVFGLVNASNFFSGTGGNGSGPALGGYRTNDPGPMDSGWVWTTGEPWSYVNWYPGQPDALTETNLHFFSGVQGVPAATWNNIEPTDLNLGGYVIERDSFPISNVVSAPLYLLPEESLDAFKGENAQGVWKLEIWDSRAGATNPVPLLLDWQLTFLFEQKTALPNIVEPFVTVSNTVPAGGWTYLVVDVPPWANVASNYLLSADLPLLVWFNQTITPTGTNPPDFGFFAGLAVTNGTQVLTNGGPTPPPLLIPGQSYYIGLQNTNATNVTFSYRVDYDITTLTNGLVYSSTTSSNGWARYFAYDVSSNAVATIFSLFNMSGNLNLVARQGPPLPSLGSFDYGGFNGGTTPETIIVLTNGAPVALRPGLWYLGVFDNTALSPDTYSILALEITNALPRIIDLTNGIPYANTNIAAPGSPQYYHYAVTPAAARVQFEILGASGDYTLVARKGLPPLPDLTTFDVLSANAGTSDELIVITTNSLPVTLTSGDWYITAVKISAGASGYNIMATEWNTTGQPIIVQPQFPGWPDFCITWNSLPGAHYIVQNSTVFPPVWNDAAYVTAFDYTSTWCTTISGQMEFFRVIEGVSTNGAAAVVPPTISGVQVTPGGIWLTWYAPITASFHVEWSDTFAPPLWTQVPTPITSTNGIFQFFDDGIVTAPFGPMRFYRLTQP